MKLNELIDKEGIDAVSAKTNLSKLILTHLLDEDFQKLNRPKSLGFLLILEREYKEIDVADLRERVKLYFEENEPSDDTVVVPSYTSVNDRSFSFFKLFMIFGILAGVWYLYTQGKFNGIVQNIKSKEDFLEDKQALETNVSIKNANQVQIVNSKVELVRTKKNLSETPIAPVVKESIPLSNDEKVVKKPLVKTKIEEIDSLEKTIKAVEKAENDMEEPKKVVEVKNSKEIKKTIIVADEISTNINAEEELDLPFTNNENEENIALSDNIITVNPTRGMLWYGFINIDTKVRKEFMRKVSTPFEVKSGRWLLVTGHGFVDVVSASQTIEVADSYKHYFYIDSDEIREIDKYEFRKLNGNRGW